MAVTDITNTEENGTVETFEFTDENGMAHCFVIESRFKVGSDDYAALLEVDPAIFEEEADSCECGHDHTRSDSCECGQDHEPEEDEEDIRIILAKVVTDENGEINIEVPSDDDFEKARKVYESLEA